MEKRVPLTKTAVDAITSPETGEIRVWDVDMPGLCVRAYPSGRRVYALKFRVDRRQRWFTIGTHGQPGPSGQTWTPQLARAKARSILGAAADGVDRSSEKEERRRSLTVSELIDTYLADGPATRPAKRASSWNADRGNLRHHAAPTIGHMKVSSVKRADVQRMVSAVASGQTKTESKKGKARGVVRVRGGAGIATRALAATSAMFGWAIEQGLAKENPARGIKLAKRPAMERFLSIDEAKRLLKVLAQLSDGGAITADHANIVKLLFFTGARRSEIVGLQWREVDLERRRLVLPPDRTKAGAKTGERRIPLNAAAVALLTDRTRTGTWVFPSSTGEGPTTGVNKSWGLIRKAAELPGLRLHDLRHSWASFAVADGASLYLIGKALGHADTRTTERYAHLADDPLVEIAESLGRRMLGEAQS